VIKTILNSVLLTLCILIASSVIMFIIINIMMGCKTWDEELWTQYNSCIKLSEIINFTN